MATSEERKSDDDDYLNGKSYERGLVRVGQHQAGLPEHPDETRVKRRVRCGPPARNSNITGTAGGKSADLAPARETRHSTSTSSTAQRAAHIPYYATSINSLLI